MIKAGKFVFLITYLAFIAQCVFSFADRPDELMAIPLVMILAGAAAFFLNVNTRDEDREFQTNIFLWAFSMRLWMSLVMYAWGLKDLFGDEDASGYAAGWGMASRWYSGGLDAFFNDFARVFFERQNEGQGFIWAIPTFLAGGPSRMIVSVVNGFAGSLLVIVIFRLARRIFGAEIGKIAGILVAFWASNILLSAMTAKEMLVIFFSWLLIYLIIRNPGGLRVKDGIASIPVMLAVFIMRFYSIYMLMTAAFFRFLVAGGRNLVRNTIFGTLVVASVFIVLESSGVVQRDMARLERLSNVIEGWREGMAATTGSGVEIYSEYDSPTMAVPVAAVYFFLAPFPWEIFSGSARSAFGAIENIFVAGILIVGFPAWRIFFKDKFVDIAPIVAFCALYAGMHIWGLANVGLAWRHKQTVMPLLFMLVAVAITQRRAGWEYLTGRFVRRRRAAISIRAAGQ
jgi:hypothetical protein